MVRSSMPRHTQGWIAIWSCQGCRSSQLAHRSGANDYTTTTTTLYLSRTNSGPGGIYRKARADDTQSKPSLQRAFIPDLVDFRIRGGGGPRKDGRPLDCVSSPFIRQALYFTTMKSSITVAPGVLALPKFRHPIPMSHLLCTPREDTIHPEGWRWKEDEST